MKRYGLLAAAVAMGITSQVFAINPFTLVEDGYPEGKGVLELENTFEFDYHLGTDHSYKNISAEHELEYGFNDNLVLRVAGSYYYEDPKDAPAGLHFDTFKLEGQYYFTNPTIDKVGLSVLGAAEIGEGSMTVTGIFVAQKDWDKWTLNYNLGVQLNIDGIFNSHDSSSTEAVIINGLGACYSITETVRIGANISAETHYDNASTYTGTSVWAGPTVNWVPNEHLWMTAGPSIQLTDTPDEPKYLFTLVVGYYF